MVKKVLDQFTTEDIYKATMATSPKVKEFIKLLMNERNFDNFGCTVGSVPINEIINIHDKILKVINDLR